MKALLWFAAGIPWLASAAETPPPAVSLEDAVRQTLQSSAGVEIQRQVVQQFVGDLTAAAGQFDWIPRLSYSHSQQREPALGAFPGGSPLAPLDFTALNNLLASINQPKLSPPGSLPYYAIEREDLTTVQAGADKQFRNGFVVRPFATVIDDRVNTAVSENVLLPPAVRSNVGVELFVPLLRGFGSDVTTAGEQVAGHDLRAARASARQEAAGRIAATVSAFWDCVAARQRLELLADTERRARQIVDLVDGLVRSGEDEPALLNEARAGELRRRGDYLDGDFAVFSARQRLGVALGLDPAGLANPPVAGGDFPSPAGFLLSETGALAQAALRDRGDLQSLGWRRRSGQTRLRQARNDLLPRINLDLGAGYAGGTPEGGAAAFGDALTRNLAGPNFKAGLSLDWPAGNHAARGAVVRRNAELRQAELTEAELSAEIASDVAIAAAALRLAIEQRKIAGETAAALAQVVANQRVKLANGESDLTALVQNEDLYFQARTSLIAAERSYAVALVQLRLVTGSLVVEDARGFRLALDALSTLPAPSAH